MRISVTVTVISQLLKSVLNEHSPVVSVWASIASIAPGTTSVVTSIMATVPSSRSHSSTAPSGHPPTCRSHSSTAPSVCPTSPCSSWTPCSGTTSSILQQCSLSSCCGLVSSTLTSSVAVVWYSSVERLQLLLLFVLIPEVCCSLLHSVLVLLSMLLSAVALLSVQLHCHLQRITVFVRVDVHIGASSGIDSLQDGDISSILNSESRNLPLVLHVKTALVEPSNFFHPFRGEDVPDHHSFGLQGG